MRSLVKRPRRTTEDIWNELDAVADSLKSIMPCRQAAEQHQIRATIEAIRERNLNQLQTWLDQGINFESREAIEAWMACLRIKMTDQYNAVAQI